MLRIDKSAWPAAATPTFASSRTVSKLGHHTTRVAVHVSFNHDGEGPMPVSGVAVTLAGQHAVTDATGAATVTVRTRRASKATMTASGAGYNTIRRTISLS